MGLLGNYYSVFKVFKGNMYLFYQHLLVFVHFTTCWIKDPTPEVPIQCGFMQIGLGGRVLVRMRKIFAKSLDS
jgi:hypothetical protein